MSAPDGSEWDHSAQRGEVEGRPGEELQRQRVVAGVGGGAPV